MTKALRNVAKGYIFCSTVGDLDWIRGRFVCPLPSRDRV